MMAFPGRLFVRRLFPSWLFPGREPERVVDDEGVAIDLKSAFRPYWKEHFTPGATRTGGFGRTPAKRRW
jgi:hypothetical protein